MEHFDEAAIESFASISWNKREGKPKYQPSWKQIMAEPPEGKVNPFAFMRELLEYHRKVVKALIEHEYDPVNAVYYVSRNNFYDMDESHQKQLRHIAEIVKKCARAHMKGKAK